MIKKLPAIYPHESVYSWLSRSYSQSGIIFNKYYLSEVFNNRKERIDFNFINIFSSDFKKIINDSIGLEELLVSHTLFKYYARFMNKDERLLVYKAGINNDDLLNKKLHIPPNKNDYFLKYCPCCVAEDRKKYGECYFHIEHQIYEMTICPVHSARLINTTIPNDKDNDVTLVTLEQLRPSIVVEGCSKSDINFLVAKYLYEVFNEKIEISNEVLVSDYLSSKLDRKHCVDNGCTKKNIIKINKELNDLYDGLFFKNLKPHRVCDVFRGANRNPYDILLIAFYLNITPGEIAHMTLSDGDVKRPIMRRVIDLNNSGIDPNEISIIVDRSIDQVNRIIAGYKKTKAKSCNHRYQH